MKCVNWKILIITSFICLLPIIFGVAVWDSLPDSMAIHFDLYGNPDNFASKSFVVFGLPVMLCFFQIFCCITNDMVYKKYGENEKVENVLKWIIPVVGAVLYTVTIGFGLGWDIDMRKIAVFLVGSIFVVTGNCLPKLNYIRNLKVEEYKARKINRFVGILTVIMGILFLVSIFLPTVYSMICLALIIPYAIFCMVYSIVISKNRE